MKLYKNFQIVLGILLCASGAGVAVRVIIGLMTNEYASFLTIAVIPAGNVPAYYCDWSALFDTCPQAEAGQYEKARDPSPDYRNPRSCYVFGIYYFMLFYSIKKTYKPKPAVSKYENRIVYPKSLIKSGFSFLLK